MPANEQPGSLVAALASVQSKLPAIPKPEKAVVKHKDGGVHSYMYANLAQISRLVLPLLGEAGLAWVTKPMLLDDGRFVLEYKLLHVSGESEEGHYPLPSGGSPQEIGSAVTYGRRYTLCSVVGVAADDDDDDGGATATVAHAAKTRREQTKERKPPDPKMVGELVDRAYAMTSPDQLRGLWAAAGAEGLLDVECTDREGEPVILRDLLTRQADALKHQDKTGMPDGAA